MGIIKIRQGFKRSDTVKSKKDMITTRYIPLGKILQGMTFKSFDSLRKKSNKIVNSHRELWMTSVFIKNNIVINPDVMTRREIHEILAENKIDITEENDICRIDKDGEIIGEWNNKRRICINKEGKINIKIQYVIV
jgi:hypothetical protein